MKILLVGATGNVGSRIVEEALARGHSVTAMSRHPGGMGGSEHLRVISADAGDPAALAKAGTGHDAAVCAISPWSAGGREAYLAVIRAVLSAVQKTGISYVLFTGGASSLEATHGRRVLDDQLARIPAEQLEPAMAVYEAYKLIGASDVSWPFLSPAGNVVPCERTGRFRVGGEYPVTGTPMQRSISTQDFAVAALEELEHPQHLRRQFNIAY